MLSEVKRGGANHDSLLGLGFESFI
jgi:hypothetical protein